MTKQMPLYDADVLASKLVDATTPGAIIEFDPYEADAAGAFVEDALGEADALQSSSDAFSPELLP